MVSEVESVLVAVSQTAPRDKSVPLAVGLKPPSPDFSTHWLGYSKYIYIPSHFFITKDHVMVGSYRLCRACITLLCCLFTGLLVAQAHCIPGVIVFSTQVQVDNFASNYPGCTVIDGNVGITGSDIHDLDGLSMLTEIGGNLLVNPDSCDISGLFGLTAIGGSLDLNTSGTQQPVEFNALQSVGGDINLNIYATNYSFNVLSQIPGSLTIYVSDFVIPTINFPSLITVAGNMYITGRSINDLNVGRNVDEVLRVLDALQTDELCPCNWKQGDETLTQIQQKQVVTEA